MLETKELRNYSIIKIEKLKLTKSRGWQHQAFKMNFFFFERIKLKL